MTPENGRFSLSPFVPVCHRKNFHFVNIARKPAFGYHLRCPRLFRRRQLAARLYDTDTTSNRPDHMYTQGENSPQRQHNGRFSL